MKIKYLILGFLVSLVFSQNISAVFAAQGDFNDVPASHPNYTAIMNLKSRNIIDGYSDGNFRPENLINRVEALKIILLGSGILVPNKSGTGGFKDGNANAWYAKYIILAVERAIINGYPDGNFQPARTLNLVESLKILLKAQNIDVSKINVTQNPYADSFTDQWYIKYLQYAKDKNLIEADAKNNIYPAQGVTRARLAEIIYRLIFIQEKGLSFYSNNSIPNSQPSKIPSVPPQITPPMPNPLPAPPTSSSAGLSLKVDGNHLVDANSKIVRLLGVNHSGQEFKCIQNGTPDSRGWGLFDGPTDLASAQAIASWNANTVRLPLNEDCWLGINGVNPKWGGAAYQTSIKDYVATLHEAGLYVILDLHWNAPGNVPAASQQPMPDADHSIEFWKSVATTFASDPAVVFDLYNEPFIYQSYLEDSTKDPWDCWLNGCTFNQYLTGGNPYTQNFSWKAVGMQTLVDTVRATGATNVIMIAGLDWANDLSGWLAHKPKDPQNAIIASWHSYPGTGCSTINCWNSVIKPLAQEVPIVIGEVGDSVCNTSTYIPTLLPWADTNGLSYLGWTWNTWGDCNHVLIKDYAGTPTANYGQAFHDFLMGSN